MIEFDESANEPSSQATLTESENGDVVIGFDGFSKRERACIDLLYPGSGLGWLDDMIEIRLARQSTVGDDSPVRQCCGNFETCEERCVPLVRHWKSLFTGKAK